MSIRLGSVVAMETSGDLLRRFLRYYLASRRTADFVRPGAGVMVGLATAALDTREARSLQPLARRI
jgi:hypothetical protein